MKKKYIFLLGSITGIIITIVLIIFFLKDRISISSDTDNNTPNTAKSDHIYSINKLKSADFLRIKDTISKPTIVSFWASWCKPCIEEIPLLNSYCKKENINIIHISVDRYNDKQKINLIKMMKKIGLRQTYIISNQSYTDLMNKDGMIKFSEESNLKFNKNSGIPYLIYLNKNNHQNIEFNGFDIEEAFINFINNKIKP